MTLIFLCLLGAPAAEISNTVVEQEGLLGDLQNDIHEVADSLPGPWKSLEGNFTAATTEANQTELGEWQTQGLSKSLVTSPGMSERGGRKAPTSEDPLWSLPQEGWLLLQGKCKNACLLQSFLAHPWSTCCRLTLMPSCKCISAPSGGA